MSDFTVVIVDDDAAVRDSLALLLQVEGFVVQAYASAREFLDGWRSSPRACVLLDMRMPGMDGMQLLRHITAAAPDVPVVLITGDSDRALQRRAQQAGATAVLSKPLDFDELLPILHRFSISGESAGYIGP